MTYAFDTADLRAEICSYIVPYLNKQQCKNTETTRKHVTFTSAPALVCEHITLAELSCLPRYQSSQQVWLYFNYSVYIFLAILLAHGPGIWGLRDWHILKWSCIDRVPDGLFKLKEYHRSGVLNMFDKFNKSALNLCRHMCTAETISP